MINSLKSTPFFQEKELGRCLKINTIGDKEILMLASNIQYLRMSKGSIVFDFGSIGDQFYLIIEGIVSVRTPLTEFEAETLIKTATYRSKVSFFQTEDDEYEYSKFDMVDDQNAEVNKNSTDKPNEDESKSSSMLINKTSFKITNGEEVKEEGTFIFHLFEIII